MFFSLPFTESRLSIVFSKLDIASCESMLLEILEVPHIHFLLSIQIAPVLNSDETMR